MSQHTLFILLLALPFLSQTAELKDTLKKWVNVRIVQGSYDGPFQIVKLTLPVSVEDKTTFVDVENTIRHFMNTQDADLCIDDADSNMQLKDSTRILYNQEADASCLSATASRIPKTFKQLNMRELTGKSIGDVRKVAQ